MQWWKTNKQTHILIFFARIFIYLSRFWRYFIHFHPRRKMKNFWLIDLVLGSATMEYGEEDWQVIDIFFYDFCLIFENHPFCQQRLKIRWYFSINSQLRQVTNSFWRQHREGITQALPWRSQSQLENFSHKQNTMSSSINFSTNFLRLIDRRHRKHLSFISVSKETWPQNIKFIGEY